MHRKWVSELEFFWTHSLCSKNFLPWKCPHADFLIRQSNRWGPGPVKKLGVPWFEDAHWHVCMWMSHSLTTQLRLAILNPYRPYPLKVHNHHPAYHKRCGLPIDSTQPTHCHQWSLQLRLPMGAVVLLGSTFALVTFYPIIIKLTSH